MAAEGERGEKGGQGQTVHLSWTVLCSDDAEGLCCKAAALYVAVNWMGSEKGMYQALLSLIHNEEPIETIFLFDRGRDVACGLRVALKFDTLVIARDAKSWWVVFPSTEEAEQCLKTIDTLMKGDLEAFFRGSEGTSGGENARETLEEITIEKVAEFLEDPSFPKLVEHIESLLVKHPFILEKFL